MLLPLPHIVLSIAPISHPSEVPLDYQIDLHHFPLINSDYLQVNLSKLQKLFKGMWLAFYAEYYSPFYISRIKIIGKTICI